MTIFTETDASAFFENAKIYYKEEFLVILEKVVWCYRNILSNNETVVNNEDAIRDYLHCNYLNNPTIRNEIDLKYHFECEPKEFGVTDGYLDIKIFNENIFENPSEYYIIECKRLDGVNKRGPTGLNSKYISDGILRFVDAKYSTFHRLNGMIGFIVNPIDINDNVGDINYLITNNYPNSNTLQKLTNDSGISGFSFLYESIHEDKSSVKFYLYHLMLDFSSQIVV